MAITIKERGQVLRLGNSWRQAPGLDNASAINRGNYRLSEHHREDTFPRASLMETNRAHRLAKYNRDRFRDSRRERSARL